MKIILKHMHTFLLLISSILDQRIQSAYTSDHFPAHISWSEYYFLRFENSINILANFQCFSRNSFLIEAFIDFLPWLYNFELQEFELPRE